MLNLMSLPPRAAVSHDCAAPLPSPGHFGLQVRVPLKDPQTIPRPLTVYISTSLSQGNFSVSDFDPDTGRGVVAVGGSPGFEAVRRQVEHVASQMFSHGGYQGQRGGGRRIQLAREDGTLDWADDHYTATSGADELLFIQCVRSARPTTHTPTTARVWWGWLGARAWAARSGDGGTCVRSLTSRVHARCVSAGATPTPAPTALPPSL